MLWKPFARLRVIQRSQKIVLVCSVFGFFRRFATFHRALGHKRRTSTYFSGEPKVLKINEVIEILTKRDFSCFFEKRNVHASDHDFLNSIKIIRNSQWCFRCFLVLFDQIDRKLLSFYDRKLLFFADQLESENGRSLRKQRRASNQRRRAA